MTPVLNDEMSDETYLSMVNEMIAVLSTFDSPGSGCISEKFIKLDTNFESYRHVTGSSCLPLPLNIAKCRRLLSIQNHNDQNCFKYRYCLLFP